MGKDSQAKKEGEKKKKKGKVFAVVLDLQVWFCCTK